MEQNNYFTPEIEDIRVGYECQFTSDTSAFLINATDDIVYDKLYPNDVQRIIRWITEDGEDMKHFIRVLYLTKEQIEKEGWIWDENIQKFGLPNNPDLELYYSYESNNLWITIPAISGWEIKLYYRANLFVGTCKDINTFRTIMKLLNIK